MFDVHATEEEDKLVLLSAMDRLGGCTQEQLLRFVVETELQNQFQFMLALAGLKEAALIRESARAEGKLLLLTPEGRQSLEMFGSRIRASLINKLDEHSPAWRKRVRSELAMPAQWEKTERGYEVTLRALEADEELLCLKVTAQNKEQARRFCRRWPECAASLYEQVMQSLGTGEPSDSQE